MRCTSQFSKEYLLYIAYDLSGGKRSFHSVGMRLPEMEIIFLDISNIMRHTSKFWTEYQLHIAYGLTGGKSGSQ